MRLRTAEKSRSVHSSSDAQVLHYFDQEHWTQKPVLSDSKTHWTFLFSYDISCTFLSCLGRFFLCTFWPVTFPSLPVRVTMLRMLLTSWPTWWSLKSKYQLLFTNIKLYASSCKIRKEKENYIVAKIIHAEEDIIIKN